MLPTPQPMTEQELAVPKTEFKGRLVSSKKANAPFLVQERHKARMAAKRAQQQQVGEQGPPAARTGSVGGLLLRYSFLVALASLLLSRMITEEWFWGYNGKYVHKSYWLPQVFSPESLAGFSGKEGPLYLAIDRDVYDVSSNRGMYGPGGSYNHFTGRDASRAFVTGCFRSGLTHDLRGLDAKQRKSLEHWKSFFANSPKYPRVGTVAYPPIPEDEPLPPPCDPKLEGGAV